MLLQISTSALADALTAVSKAMYAKNSIMILDNALLSCENGKYYITGGSTDTCLRMPIEVNLMKGNFEPIMLPLALLNQSLALLPDVPIVFDVTPAGKGYSVKCEYSGKGEQKGRFSFTAESGKDYPMMNVSGDTLVDFTVETTYLLPPLVACADFTEKKLDNSPLFNLTVCASCEGYDVVGTNGHRLYKYSHEVGAGFASGEGVKVQPDGQLMQQHIMMLPQVVSALAYAFRKQERICVSMTGNTIIYSSDGIRMMITAREGKYPNYNSVIPFESQYKVVLNRKELTEALKRVNLFASAATNLIKLTANGLLINIGAEDIDYSRASSEDIVIIDSNLPSDFKVGINASHFLRLVNNVTTENVRLLFNSPSQPILIKDDDDNTNVTMLVMPMLLN